MKTHFFSSFLCIVFIANSIAAQNQIEAKLRPYVDVLKTEGEEPINFVINKLEKVDLIIFDDALHTVYTLNKTLPKNQRLKIFGVENPTYWSEIKTEKDVELFRKTLRSHDFLMYKTIALEMKNFENGDKGIFLTNSRHAYKGIKNRKKEYYWNSGTYLHQWHPGKTYSIHFHNVYLIFEKNEEVSIRWDRIANGIWDCAFRAVGNKPIAISFKDNVFGKENYIGNHMLDVTPNLTMYDAYDALIFLGPLEEMHKEDYGVKYLKELIDKLFVAEPKKLLPQAAAIGPIDAWKNESK